MTRRGLLTIALFFIPMIAQAESHLLRHPTYSKGRVAFSYLGDIWIANENGSDLHRLTDHLARDVYPRFSPDGNWIAFSSNRDKNYDVFVISAQGGKPKQLTFNSADDNVVGWTPDGQKVMFVSGRGKGGYPSLSTSFEVPRDGGIEQPIHTDVAAWASYSQDGTRLAVTRHGTQWQRKTRSFQQLCRPLGDECCGQDIYQARR